MANRAVILNNLFQGGRADSPFAGAENSVAEAVGLDIHSDLGLIKVNQKLSKISSTTIDDLVLAIVNCSDGKNYHFGSTNGKIWSQDLSTDAFALEATASPAAGSAGILDAREYQGYIYYAMQNRLGRWQLGTAWSTRNDNYATFGVGSSTDHPMAEVNLVLYIGDGNRVAQVDAGTFAANALDLFTPNVISALGKDDTDLVIGTRLPNNVARCSVFRWNTWSVSYSTEDTVDEVGINAFIPLDNLTLVSAGINGALYVLNGARLEKVKTLQGTFSPTSYGKVYPNAVGILRGLPLFAFSNGSGNPLAQGIWSYASKDITYRKVLNLEYVISQNVTSNVIIGAICVVGNNMYVSWKDSNSSAVYGVDKLDWSNKYASAYFRTRVMRSATAFYERYKTFVAAYESLPASTDIVLKYRKDRNGSFTTLTSRKDATRLWKYAELDVQAGLLELEVHFTVSSNSAPVMRDLIVFLA